MVNRVKAWLDKGYEVKIFTARANLHEAVVSIKAWCVIHLGKELEVTNVKDMDMWELWDDRAVQVVANMGIPVGKSTRGLN